MERIWQRLWRSLLSRFARTSKRRRLSRERSSSVPLPNHWTEILERRCAHYRRLPAPHRAQFKKQLQIFLAEKRIRGVEMEASEETRILVAASATSLSVGWQDYTWDQLAEVLIFPEDFDRDYNFGGTDASGNAHPWGIVILSEPALIRSFDETGDVYHVGFHEFAHLLDLSGARFDGIPSYLSDERVLLWLKIMQHEEERLKRGDSVLDQYGLSNRVELFATSVEAFFQAPISVAKSHRELYAFLSTYFDQDPAGWSETNEERSRSKS
jgi:Mlc titration factor MtfA (ptsG expression regulator)